MSRPCLHPKLVERRPLRGFKTFQTQQRYVSVFWKHPCARIDGEDHYEADTFESLTRLRHFLSSSDELAHDRNVKDIWNPTWLSQTDGCAHYQTLLCLLDMETVISATIKIQAPIT